LREKEKAGQNYDTETPEPNSYHRKAIVAPLPWKAVWLRPAIFVFLAVTAAAAQRQFPVTGLVVSVDRPAHTLTVSHGEIAGYMDAMTMPFHTRSARIPEAVHPGSTVGFTLLVDGRNSWIDNIHVIEFNSAERDPVLASRLKLMDSATSGASPLAVGSQVPDFTLTDQSRRPVTLSAFRGKVIAMDFVYTRCPLPDYCFRLSNNFARLQKRFSGNRDLVLLTVSFDPAHDVPEALARYAEIWKADLAMWHFLTGPPADVNRICDQFGVGHWLDDGLFAHSLHTAVIDRQGRLVANMEGNQFSVKQLGDMVESVLKRSPK
jgi:protein SCO1/2